MQAIIRALAFIAIVLFALPTFAQENVSSADTILGETFLTEPAKIDDNTSTTSDKGFTIKRTGALASGGVTSPAGLIKWLLSTIAILGIIFVLAYLLKKSRLVQKGTGNDMVLLGQMAVGPKERLIQVKVGQRRLLVGVTAHSVNLVADLSQDEVISTRGYSKEQVAQLGDKFEAELTAHKVALHARRKMERRKSIGNEYYAMPDDDILRARAHRAQQDLSQSAQHQDDEAFSHMLSTEQDKLTPDLGAADTELVSSAPHSAEESRAIIGELKTNCPNKLGDSHE